MTFMSNHRIPIILHTDIGEDIDDTWALGMALKLPNLDLKLVLTDTGNTIYRTKICAKLLQRAHREDIDLGIGLPQNSTEFHEAQKKWVENFDLNSYRGNIYEDGIDRMIELVMNVSDQITLVSISPVTSIAEALRREPRIAEKIRFVGMHGCIHRRHYGVHGTIIEYNIHKDIAACQTVFNAPWREIVLTPLDSCGVVQLSGELYRRIKYSDDPLVTDIIKNYHIWSEAHDRDTDPVQSSLLFDTVAVHLAYSIRFLKMEKMNIRLTDDGYTVPDHKHGKSMNIAIDWLDLPGFCNYLVEIINGDTNKLKDDKYEASRLRQMPETLLEQDKEYFTPQPFENSGETSCILENQ